MAGALNTSHLLGALGFQVVAINGTEVNGLPSGGAYNGLNFITVGASAVLNPLTRAVDITLPAGGGGDGTPGGALGMLQFFDGADFAGASDIIWTPGSRLLDVGGTAGTLLRAANASGDGFAPLELRNLASDAVPILRLNGTGTNGANVQFHSGTRNPSGVVPGNTGDIYVQSVIGTGAANLWQNTGTGTTSTWTQFATGTGAGDVVGPASANPMSAGSADTLVGSGYAVGIPVFADGSGKVLSEFQSVNGGFLYASPAGGTGEGAPRLEWENKIPGGLVNPDFGDDLTVSAARDDRFPVARFTEETNGAFMALILGNDDPRDQVLNNIYTGGVYHRNVSPGVSKLYVQAGLLAGDWHEVHSGPNINLDSVTATGAVAADSVIATGEIAADSVAAASVVATGEITADVVTVSTAIDLTSGPGVGSIAANHAAALETLTVGGAVGQGAVEVDDLGRVGFSRNATAGAVVRAHAPHIVGVRTTDAADIADQIREALASVGLIIDFTTAT